MSDYYFAVHTIEFSDGTVESGSVFKSRKDLRDLEERGAIRPATDDEAVLAGFKIRTPALVDPTEVDPKPRVKGAKGAADQSDLL